MARPRKCKNVCGLPKITSFIQENFLESDPALTVLTVEEYEVIRLIDYENMTQEECSVQMQVSRPTVQILYNKARKKISEFILNGGRLQIQGGDYKVCRGNGHCHRRRCGW